MEEQDVIESHPVEEYPEGGWGWVVCAASFLTSFIVFGVHNSFGILYSTLVNELDLGEAESGKTQGCRPLRRGCPTQK